MKKTILLCICICLSCFVVLACDNPNAPSGDKQPHDTVPVDTAGKYKNPVFEPVLADPSVVRSPDGWFYAYGTADAWDKGKAHLVPILKSKDLVRWTYVRDAFQHKPSWKSKGGIWAPDVTYVDGKYYMYYAFSIWGDPNPGIGLAISDKPEGPFTDQGKIFLSKEIGVPNSIDPFFCQEGGKKYLFWGSFHGIYGIELSDDGKSTVGDKFQIAGNDFEGTYIYKKEGYYYFFGSSGSCCDGAKSTYSVSVARSKSLKGPYVNEEGENALKSRGTPFIKGNTKFAGPGHNAEIVTDDNGDDWFIYHAIEKDKPYLPSGANRRTLMLDKIIWKNGWPTISGGVPSTGYVPGPVFK